MEEKAKVTGCIVSYNNADIIEKCIQSILDSTKNMDFKLYVVDNCSDDGTPELIARKFPEVVLIKNEKNSGFGGGHNLMFPHLGADYHFVINPDIYMQSGVAEALCSYLDSHKDCSLITPKILNIDGSEQFLPKKNPKIRYVILSKFPPFKKYRKIYTRECEELKEPTAIEFCTGCFFCVRSELFKKLGGFDKRFFMYMEDADFTRRAAEEGKVIFYPGASVFHEWHRDNTRSAKGVIRWLHSMVRYFNKWGWKF